MTYVLGTAAVTNAPLRLQNTVQGDGFASLAAAYGVTDKQIWEMQPEAQGKAMIVQNVEPFVRSRAGWTPATGLNKFVAGGKPNNPAAFGVPGTAGTGFAHFTAATQLMLPNMPRLDGKGPRDVVLPEKPGPSKAGMNGLAIAFGLAVIGFAVFGGKKKPGAKPSGARRRRRR